MGKLIGAATCVAILTGALFGSQVLAAEWVPIKQEDHTVREIDASSINKNGPLVTFTARHTFEDRNEYKVSRREARYLLIHTRANCGFRTLAQLATEAYDEKMVLITKQRIQQPQDLPVTKGSIDEIALNFVCAKNVQQTP
ncbi:MAG: hypothetical protein K8H84_10405 [Sulfuricella denitrificans]|nr:hypothetical protein [Sulfuricella denitrificans]